MSAELGIAAIELATEEHFLTVPGYPNARLRVYWPSTERPSPPVSWDLPILVLFLSGGFEIASIDWVWWDASFRECARDAGVIVVAGEYLHAPEAAFPTQPEQCWKSFEWAAEHAGADGDRRRIRRHKSCRGNDVAEP